jgi:hypothetical protein
MRMLGHHLAGGKKPAIAIRIAFGLLLILLLIQFPHQAFATVTSWSTPGPIPINPAFNFNPSFTQEHSAQGKIWLVWQRTTSTGDVDIYEKNFIFPGVWTADQPIVATPAQEITPAITTLANGTLMLLWARQVGTFQLFYKLNNLGTWSGETQLTFTTTGTDDTGPHVLQTKDGNIWVVWERKIGTHPQIYYKIFNGKVWGSDTFLTQTTGFERQPSIAQTKDGKIWVVWSSNPSTNYNLRAKTFSGISWSADFFLTSTNLDDIQPALLVDGEGTLWVFWSRISNGPGGSFDLDIFDINSLDNGATFSRENAFTNTPTIDERNVAVAEFSDNRIWVAWSNAPQFASSFDIYLSQSNPIPVHDLDVTRVTSAPAVTNLTRMATSNITVLNSGDFLENAKVSLYMNNTLIASRNVTIGFGNFAMLSFNWNTSLAGGGRFSVRGVVAPPVGETLPNQLDDNFTGGTMVIIPPGDVNNDGRIDIRDAAIVAFAFDCRVTMPCYNPAADITKDGVVDIRDMAIVAFYFGFHV